MEEYSAAVAVNHANAVKDGHFHHGEVTVKQMMLVLYLEGVVMPDRYDAAFGAELSPDSIGYSTDAGDSWVAAC